MMEDNLNAKWWEIAHAEHKREAGLINNRVTWLLTSQSILFAAFAISIKEPLGKFNNNQVIIDTLTKLIPKLGLFITFCILTGIVGAYLAMFRINKCMHKYPDQTLGISRLINKGVVPTLMGMTASIGTSLTIFVGWIYLLVKLY